MAGMLYPLLKSMAADPAAGPLPPLLHNTTSLEAAVSRGTLSTGYASGGFLVFYYIGVSKVLQQLGIVKPGKTLSAGTSIGSLAQGLDQGMGSHDAFIYNHSVRFCDFCRRNRNCFQILDKEFSKLAATLVAENRGVAERITGKGCIVISRGTMDKPVGENVCTFKDDEDVLQAVRASSYVPGWSGKAPYILFRGAPAFDGVFSQYVPCHDKSTFCIKVSGMPPFDPPKAVHNVLQGHGPAVISMALQTLTAILGPDPGGAIMRGLQQNTLGTIDLPKWFEAFATIQTPGLFDIWPGRFGKTPLTQTEWMLYALTPPPRDVIIKMYLAGQDDARAWAKMMGWPAAQRR